MKDSSGQTKSFGIVPSWRLPENEVRRIAKIANYECIRTYGVNGVKMYAFVALPKVESREHGVNDNQAPEKNEPLAAPSV